MTKVKEKTAPTEALAEAIFEQSRDAYHEQGFPDSVVMELEKALDVDRIKKKPGSGFDYLSHDDVRRTANEIFGYGGWGYEISSVKCVNQGVFTKGEKDGYAAAYNCVIDLHIRLADGGWLHKGGTGFGDAYEYTDTRIVSAHEKGMKESESDALKRAFMSLGDQFGLILYAKGEEKQRLQQEAVDREYAQPANELEIAAGIAISALKGKLEATQALLDADIAEYGHVRQGRLAAIVGKLATLLDAGEAPPTVAPTEGVVTADVLNSEQAVEPGEAAKAAELTRLLGSTMVADTAYSDAQTTRVAEWSTLGDAPATGKDVQDVLAFAGSVSAEAQEKALKAIVQHRAKQDGLCSAKWLKKLTDGISKSAKGPETPLVAAGNPTEIAAAEQAAAEAAAAAGLQAA